MINEATMPLLQSSKPSKKRLKEMLRFSLFLAYVKKVFILAFVIIPVTAMKMSVMILKREDLLFVGMNRKIMHSERNVTKSDNVHLPLSCFLALRLNSMRLNIFIRLPLHVVKKNFSSLQV